MIDVGCNQVMTSVLLRPSSCCSKRLKKIDDVGHMLNRPMSVPLRLQPYECLYLLTFRGSRIASGTNRFSLMWIHTHGPKILYVCFPFHPESYMLHYNTNGALTDIFNHACHLQNQPRKCECLLQIKMHEITGHKSLKYEVI